MIVTIHKPITKFGLFLFTLITLNSINDIALSDDRTNKYVYGVRCDSRRSGGFNELFGLYERCEGSFSSVQAGPPVLKLSNDWSCAEIDKKYRILWGYGTTGQGLDEYYIDTGTKIESSRPRAPKGYGNNGGYYRVYNLSQNGVVMQGAKYTGEVFDPWQIAIVNREVPAWGISCAPNWNEMTGELTYTEDACSVFGSEHPVIKEMERRRQERVSSRISIPKPSTDCTSPALARNEGSENQIKIENKSEPEIEISTNIESTTNEDPAEISPTSSKPRLSTNTGTKTSKTQARVVEQKILISSGKILSPVRRASIRPIGPSVPINKIVPGTFMRNSSGTGSMVANRLGTTACNYFINFYLEEEAFEGNRNAQCILESRSMDARIKQNLLEGRNADGSQCESFWEQFFNILGASEPPF